MQPCDDQKKARDSFADERESLLICDKLLSNMPLLWITRADTALTHGPPNPKLFSLHHETVMRQSWDSHETVMRQPWDSHETVYYFEQAQPKMYHSPKVDDGVDVFFKISWKPIFQRFFFEEFKTDITPKPLELFN